MNALARGLLRVAETIVYGPVYSSLAGMIRNPKPIDPEPTWQHLTRKLNPIYNWVAFNYPPKFLRDLEGADGRDSTAQRGFRFRRRKTRLLSWSLMMASAASREWCGPRPALLAPLSWLPCIGCWEGVRKIRLKNHHLRRRAPARLQETTAAKVTALLAARRPGSLA